jgi:phosphoribosyl 1,2-cyclic phosphodiesterase
MRAKLWGSAARLRCPVRRRSVSGATPHVCRSRLTTGRRSCATRGPGSGRWGRRWRGARRRLHVLLTHLHLDHIQGLMFVAPFFDREVEIAVWGPPAAGRALRQRLAHYISNGLSPDRDR